LLAERGVVPAFTPAGSLELPFITKCDHLPLPIHVFLVLFTVSNVYIVYRPVLTVYGIYSVRC